MLAQYEIKDNECHITDVKSVIVDGKNIKEDTFYTLENGKFIETD